MTRRVAPVPPDRFNQEAHSGSLETPKHTDAEYYGFSMTGLFGQIDDASLSGYSSEGVALLRKARDLFWEEFQSRHPDACRRE